MAGKNDRGIPGVEERGGGRRRGSYGRLLSRIFPSLFAGAAYMAKEGLSPEDVFPGPLPHEPITTYGGETGVPLGEPIATYGGEGGVPIGGAKSGGRTYDMRPKENLHPEMRDDLLNPEMRRPSDIRDELLNPERYRPNPGMKRHPDNIMEDIFKLEDRDNFMRNPEMRRRNPEMRDAGY